MSKRNSGGNVIIAILSILLVFAVVAFVFKFTNGLNEDLKTFYIEHNGKQIVATDSQIMFDTESEHRFDCKYLSNPDNNSFNLKVVPNITEETDFNFTVDGKSHKWSEVENLTSCFSIDKQNNYFIISFPADFSMEKVLSFLYPENQVVISDDLILYQYYYTLHVSSYNNKINYYIDFNVSGIADKDIEINNLQQQVNDLTQENAELQEYVTYYENFISKFEDSETAVITLEVDDEVYAVFTMAKGSTMFDIAIPESIDYEFNGWTVNGEEVSIDGYEITENTTFVATLTYGYDITFVVDGVTVKTERVVEGNLITPPESPTKDGYQFYGWVDSDNSKIDFTTYEACEKITFTAKFLVNTINVSFEIVNISSDTGGSSGGGGSIEFSATPYGSTSCGYVSPSYSVLSIENQNATATFTLYSGYTYSDFEVNSSSSGGAGASPYGLISYPFGVSINGNTITLTLSSILTANSSYTVSILVTGSGTSSGGGSSGGGILM